MKKFRVLFIGFSIIFIFYSCGNKHTYKKNIISNQYFIPTKIPWDTLFSLDKESFDLIHNNFKTIHFTIDSNLFVFKSENEIVSDSILLAVENVEVFKGKYTWLNDSTLCPVFKRVAHVDTLPFTDTIRISYSRNLRLWYEGREYKIANKLFIESINRLSQLEGPFIGDRKAKK